VRDPLGQLSTVTLHSLEPSNLTDIASKPDMWLMAFYATQGVWGACGEVNPCRMQLLWRSVGSSSRGSKGVCAFREG
jgi:hypothetical protein